ncbi:MAG: hypothetical protein AAF495_16985 [Pseudomonadota bacterium]
MIMRTASAALVLLLGLNPALAQVELPPNPTLDDLNLSNPQFGRDLPLEVGPRLGVDEPLMNFKSQSHFNVYRPNGGLPSTIRPGNNGHDLMRDRDGRVVGYVVAGHGGTQIVKDRTGRYLGTLVQGPGGQLQIRDRNGKISHQLR